MPDERWLPALYRELAFWCVLLIGSLVPFSAASARQPIPFSSIAFYYGDDAPVQVLERFDVAVVEPDHGLKITRRMHRGTRWLAYISVGEVTNSRAYFRRIPKKWLVGYNDVWKAHVVDQSAPGWPAFLASRVARPLWRAGYRGFFLDTLDSYELSAHSPKDKKRQQQGLVRVIKALRRAYPHAMIVMNRGFELLSEVHSLVDAVAFESLYRAWDEATGRYRPVASADRDWLVAQAKRVQDDGLPVVAIDYCAVGDERCVCDTASLIRSHGYIPYVGDGHLDAIDRSGCNE